MVGMEKQAREDLKIMADYLDKWKTEVRNEEHLKTKRFDN